MNLASPNFAPATKTSAIRLRPLSSFERIGDLFLFPAMFVLGGMKRGCVQRTHYWHCQRIDPAQLDSTKSVVIAGEDDAPVGGNRLFPFPFFHAPIFGGWTDYRVLQVPEYVGAWHVGWVHREVPIGSRQRAHVQRISIPRRQVKVLSQARGFVTEFFALNKNGEQVPLATVDAGRLGDQRYTDLYLL